MLLAQFSQQTSFQGIAHFDTLRNSCVKRKFDGIDNQKKMITMNKFTANSIFMHKQNEGKEINKTGFIEFFETGIMNAGILSMNCKMFSLHNVYEIGSWNIVRGTFIGLFIT